MALLAARASGTERSLVLSISTAHAIVHAIELAYAALLLRIEAEFGADLLLLGALANIGAFAFGLGALPSGLLVDKLGSMRVLQLSLGGGAIGALLVAVSPSEIVLGVTLAVLGLLTGLYHPAGFAILARTRRRARNVGLHGVVGNLGIAVTPVLLSGIAVAADWRISYVALGILAAIGFFYTLRLPRGGVLDGGPRTSDEVPEDDSPPDPESAGAPARTPLTPLRFWWVPLAVIYIANVIQGFVYRGSVTFIPTHIEEQITGSLFGIDGVGLAGALSTIALLGGALGWYIGGHLAERYPRYPLVMTTWLATTPLLVLTSITGGPLLIVVIFAFVVLNFAMAPALVTLVADYSPPGRMGASYGVMFFLAFGLGSFAATAAGFTADEWGTGAVFTMLALVSAVGAVLCAGVFILTRSSRPQRSATLAC